jgi:hypothetical protein
VAEEFAKQLELEFVAGTIFSDQRLSANAMDKRLDCVLYAVETFIKPSDFIEELFDDLSFGCDAAVPGLLRVGAKGK